MSITIAILIVTALISYQGLKDSNIIRKLAHHPYSEHHNKEYYRLISSGFVHGSMGHLLINGFVLYMFGEQLEKYVFLPAYGDVMGKIMFITLYLTAIVVGDLGTHFKHKDNPSYTAVGASGATSALVMVYVLVAPWSWFIYPPVPAFVFGFGYIFYSMWAEKNKQDNIGHSAHLWGAIYGILFMVATKPTIILHFFEKMLQPEAPPFF